MDAEVLVFDPFHRFPLAIEANLLLLPYCFCALLHKLFVIWVSELNFDRSWRFVVYFPLEYHTHLFALVIVPFTLSELLAFDELLGIINQNHFVSLIELKVSAYKPFTVQKSEKSVIVEVVLIWTIGWSLYVEILAFFQRVSISEHLHPLLSAWQRHNRSVHVAEKTDLLLVVVASECDYHNLVFFALLVVDCLHDKLVFWQSFRFFRWSNFLISRT